jgi:predicted nucleotidyltransferase
MRYSIDSARFKDLIAKRGYACLTEFAKAHGFNRATLHHYMKGQGGPLAESYYALCEALQADPVDLLSPMAEGEIDGASEIMPIVKALCAVDRGIAVGLFGSRAKGRPRKYSDWDLGIARGRRPLGGVEFLRLKRTVDDAVDALPREVDFINLDVAPEWFLRGIDDEPIFLAGDSNAWAYFLGVLHGAKRRKET